MRTFRVFGFGMELSFLDSRRLFFVVGIYRFIDRSI